ncbi:interferon regulatory factor 3 [Cololabis saira]|uniref:interferon regulatory factor 3 n=1 Tax=Cololabis saira TaxID=129043 RepID=UPI002AD521D7|nr:interferon regulatory factor 3 [Cololabis saira]
MAYPRPLLIPWLREKIDSGRFPGVNWTNLEKTEFTIPWKHALRQDSSDTDVLIFKAWAEVSGNGRAQGDASVWKRNFRSALRAKGFKLQSDNKNDTANPHKVFQWPKDSALGANSSAGSQEQDDDNLYNGFAFPENQAFQNFVDDIYLPEDIAMPAGQDLLQECLRDLNIGPDVEGTVGFELPPEQQQLQNQIVIGGHPLPGQQQDPVMFSGAASETGLPGQPACPVQGDVGGAYATHFLQTMHKTGDGDNFKTEFKITVCYRGEKVLETLVGNEAGFRLVYRPNLVGAVSDCDTDLTLVSLPKPGPMLDKTQAKLTQRILDILGDGVDVRVSGHVVYGQRRGEIKAFWSFDKFDNTRKPQEISKLNPETLYPFRTFLQGIMDFIQGRDRDCPPCTLFICLGEKWPDPENRPWEKKLITVEVVLTSMELLKSIAVGGGASSLQSVELQMSLEEMMELH